MISIDCGGNLEELLKREWLETNGLGGFASSTVAGIDTRRYHGLLTAALNPPGARHVLLSKLEETLFLNGARYDLSANLYPGTVHPEGYLLLREFRLDPFPVFTYEAGGVRIEKRVFMPHGENTVVVEYEVLPDEGVAPPCTLEVRPLIAFRDFHATTHANGTLDPAVERTDGAVSIQPYPGLPRLRFEHNAHWVETEGSWYYRFQYPAERERGLDSEEDLFAPFVLQFSLGEGRSAAVVATLAADPRPASMAPALRQSEIARRAALTANLSVNDDPLVADLARAADQFIVRRANGRHTAIAGYPWFADWGRDTMIALPGLTLVTGRFDVARDILLAFAEAADMGMLPNRFADNGGEPEYNTVDAALWFFEAARKFLEYTGDYEFVRANLWDPMKSILDWHLMGTRYGIRCGADGLIAAGAPDTQLTWMDAKIGDFVATPRHGKPVEIQALWYNALRVTEDLARRFDDPEQTRLSGRMADRASDTFNRVFWNDAAGCLYDVVRDDYRDPAIRPNQVIALSLGHTMLSGDRARSILAVAERDLLTDYGLRTLSPSDSHYIGRYEGDPYHRDSAYHQGTVWPWLLGPYVTAYARAFQTDPEDAMDACEKAGLCVDCFRHHLRKAGLGTISEILDGDAPFEPRGCIGQAWSVAEVLRVLVEDVHGVRPNAAPVR